MNPTTLESQTDLDDLAGGYRAAQILFTACRLDVFELIGEKGKTLDQITEHLRSDSRGTRILLDALAGLGLLVTRNGRYHNSELALERLTLSSQGSRLSHLLHSARLYERWAGLFDAVMTGRPTPEERIDSRIASGKTAFAKAMADSARQTAALTAACFDLEGVSTLLDIGGGPGLYAIEFARRRPELKVSILDDAETLRVAERNLAASGLGERVRLLPGNAHADDLCGPYDFIFISNVVHIYSADRNRELVLRCATSLNPGGRLALKDFFLQENEGTGKSGPLWNLLFAANMLVGTEEGDCYTEEEVGTWCLDSDLRFAQRIPLTEKTSILVFRR